jgi:hypothetical protein
MSNPSSSKTRVGIATGLVVVGDLIGEGSAQEQSVVGETPNLAARLQALAEPDAVVIAAGTRRLVGSLFEYQSLGEVELKGLAAPVPAFRVLGEGKVGSRFEALRSGETPLVGPARGNRAARPPLGASKGWYGTDRADLGRARDRQIAPGGGIP